MSTRCSTCVMPSSVPGSGLESSDTCNWCKDGYPHYIPKGEDSLRSILNAHRNGGSGADCLVGLSGGKDSSFAVLELATKFGLKVEAFTYVHGGLTPFALENAKRVCRALGIEHHTVSLNGDEHLNSFKTYFKAWVKSPKPITAAMSCVACKHLHLLGTRLAAKRKIPMVVWANSPIEDPPFVVLKFKPVEGAHEFKRENIIKAGTRMLMETPSLAAAFLKHPRTSTLGCLSVTPISKFLSLRYRGLTHIYFYDFIDWQPKTIVENLTSRVGWEKPNAPDDWRSDCSLNAFKEFMFQSMLGSSYTDAFLSNQIRYGLMTRAEAWEKLKISKKYYAREVPRVLKSIGLESLEKEISLDCFNIGE
jgi:hypothetical protein